MKKPVFLTFTILSSLFLSAVAGTTFSFAQDRGKADDTLRYFPEGKYKLIFHTDHLSVSTADSYPLFRWFKDKVRGQTAFNSLYRDVELPEYLRGKEIFATYGMRVTRDKMSKESFSYEHINVLGFDNLELQIRNTVQKNQIVKTGKFFRGKPVYTFTGSNLSSEGKDYFAYATDFQELLISDSPDIFETMLASAEGTEPSLIDSEGFAALKGLIPDLGHVWTITFVNVFYEQMLENARRSGRAESDLNSMADRFDKMMQIRTGSLQFGNRIVETAMLLYKNEEYAAKDLKLVKREPPKNSPDSIQLSEKLIKALELRYNKSTVRLAGNRIITTTPMDQELIQAELALAREIKTKDKTQEKNGEK